MNLEELVREVRDSQIRIEERVKNQEKDIFEIKNTLKPLWKLYNFGKVGMAAMLFIAAIWKMLPISDIKIPPGKPPEIVTRAVETEEGLND